eukprot:c28323_g1_i1 orf=637-2607(-)
MWNNVIELDTNRGLYKVCGKLWTVGPRYKLLEHIGAGSYGDVCQAADCETSQIVALKRVADVLCCPMLAKRVLREVCIMRRLSHSYIIALTDVFTNLSLEVNGGIDLYIATEFADRGDIYHLKEPVLANDVKLLIWQLLVGVRYMHSCQVWHRDIKSENVLLTSRMCLKICDFGLSRSAAEASSNFEPRETPDGRASMKKVLLRQYTKMVVTPSYRAPEVVMSRGQYSSAIDIWSLGCIFWELLIRSINPQIVGPPPRPLFGIRGEPATPEEGENYANDSHSPLAEQLDVIFNVIGTPCWKDIESVPSETWRAYLKCLPGRAGNLFKTLSGYIDDEALDLLSRMLAFDPARRCTAEEALAHTYFKNLKKPNEARQLFSEDAASTASGQFWKIRDPAMALEHLEHELEDSALEPDGGKQKLEWLLLREVEHQQQQNLLRQSVLCSLAAAKLSLQNGAMTSGSANHNKEPSLSHNQVLQLAARGIQIPLCCDQQPEQQCQESAPLSCVASRNKELTTTAVGNGNIQEAPKKKAVTRKTIIQQGSLRIEINAASPAELPPNHPNTLSAVAAQATLPLIAQMQQVQQLNTLQCKLSTQIISSQLGGTNQGKAMESQKEANGVDLAGDQHPEVVLPRRSPRLRDLQANEIPLRKRGRMQAG